MTTSTGIRRERQQRTREALLSAAERVFARHGYHGARVPWIAEEAGVSTGAIYSNFAGKEELFLAMMSRVAEQGARRRASTLDRGIGDRGATLAEMAGDWTQTVDERPELVLLMVEFWLYALRRPERRDLLADFLATIRDSFETAVDELAAPSEAERTRLATAAQALAYGFAMQRLTDPDVVSTQDFTRALGWLLAGATDTGA